MKKYIKPSSEVVIIDTCSMVCDSPSSKPTMVNEVGNGVQMSKERENVNFSDEESIW